MQQGFNEVTHHREVHKHEHEQSAIVLKQLAQWLGRHSAKKALAEQSKPTHTMH